MTKEVFGQGKFSCLRAARSPYFAAVCLSPSKNPGRLLQSGVHGDVVRCGDAEEAACCECFACDGARNADRKYGREMWQSGILKRHWPSRPSASKTPREKYLERAIDVQR